jgi:hypothetical protein
LKCIDWGIRNIRKIEWGRKVWSEEKKGGVNGKVKILGKIEEKKM